MPETDPSELLNNFQALFLTDNKSYEREHKNKRKVSPNATTQDRYVFTYNTSKDRIGETFRTVYLERNENASYELWLLGSSRLLKNYREPPINAKNGGILNEISIQITNETDEPLWLFKTCGLDYECGRFELANETSR